MCAAALEGGADRLLEVQEVARELLRASASAAELAAALVGRAGHLLGAVDAAVYLAEGGALRRAAACGASLSWPDRLGGADPHPISSAARAPGPEWIEGAAALVSRYPSLSGQPWRPGGGWSFFPLVGGGAPVVGAACLGFDRPGGFTAEDRRLVAKGVELCREAVERAHRLESELAAQAGLSAALAQREEFLTVASHELKTPVTSLSLQLAVLRRELRGAPSARLSLIERQVSRISALISRLLDLSQISEGSLQLDLTELDLSAAVRDITERLEPEMARERCALRVDAPEKVVGRWDPLRVEQVVVNLCVNAAKFAPGTTVDVSVKVEGREAVISVRDRGVGIAAEDLDRIFGKFERAAPSTEYGGLGLGLFVVREVVRAFGGRVEVESQPGQGSTFAVRLPGVLPEDPPR